MKIIHTADWHIGKLVHQLHMTEDQKYLLEQFIEVIKAEKPDVIIIAGDIYDRPIPPVDAVKLLDEVFYKILVELEVPILAIAGNHDSADRLNFGNRIFRDKGFYIEGKLKKVIEPVVIKDENGPVNFYLIPYAEPAVVREMYENSDIHSHDDAVRTILERIKENMNKEERNVVVTHGFMIGSEEAVTSESERPLSIGGTECVDVEYFSDFHYTALGHLHGPQKVKWDKVRYSGSLMKYSFSEVDQKKSITVVNMDSDGEINFDFINLKPRRDMRKIKGNLSNLLDPEVYRDTDVEDYIMAVLTDEGDIIDAIGKLRAVYPNVLRIEREKLNIYSEESRTSAGKDFIKKTTLNLFEEFYKNIGGKVLDENKSSIIESILKEMNRERRSK
jgi:exonuclease SbcD